MKYIVEDKNVTKEYAIIIDGEKLEKIIKELNEKCCRAIKKTVRVTSGSKEEAIAKINSTDNHGINIVNEVNSLDNYKHLQEFAKKQYVYECEFYYKQISYLEYILNIILNAHRAKLKDNVDITKSIKILLDYENNDELKTYQERMARDGITKELYYEYENNKDFDFELLRSLYQEAKDCFKLSLLSETIHYDTEENRETYRLGRK